jgi:hypothetical protein
VLVSHRITCRLAGIRVRIGELQRPRPSPDMPSRRVRVRAVPGKVNRVGKVLSGVNNERPVGEGGTLFRCPAPFRCGEVPLAAIGLRHRGALPGCPAPLRGAEFASLRVHDGFRCLMEWRFAAVIRDDLRLGLLALLALFEDIPGGHSAPVTAMHWTGVAVAVEMVSPERWL